MNQSVGAYIKKIRKSRQMTLQQIAEATGFSVAYLSLMERGLNSPTVDNLHKICRVLDTTIADLFNNLEAEKSCVKKQDRRVTFELPGSIKYEAVTEGKSDILCICMTVYDNNTHVSGAHVSDELGIIIRGSLNLWIEGVQYELEEGDSVYIGAGKQHSFQRVSDHECESLWVSVAYRQNSESYPIDLESSSDK